MIYRIFHIYKNRILTILLCLFMMRTTVTPSIVYAAEEEQERVVRVGYYNNDNFEEGTSDEEIKSGYAYEYLRKVAYYSGWKYEYVYGKWPELLQMLQDGEIDVMAGISYTKEREAVISFPDYEMGKESYYIYKHEADMDINENDLSTFTGKKIGCVKNTMMTAYLHKWADENHVPVKIIEYDGFAAEKQAFENHEIDGYAELDYSITAGTGRTAVIKLGELPYYLGVAKNRDDLLHELNEALEKLDAVEPYFRQNLQYNYYGGSVINNTLTASEQEWVRQHSVMNVGYFEGYMPYSGTDSEGNATGLLTDVMNEILNKLNLSNQIALHYESYKNYDELLHDLHEGKIDAAFPAGGELWHAEQDGIFSSTPVVSAGVDLAFVGSYDDDTVASIAVNENNRMQYYFTAANFPDAEIVFCDSTKDCLNAVLHGKAGSTILNGIRTNSLLSDSKYSTMVSLQLSNTDDFCFGVVEGNDALLLLLNRGITLIGDDYGINASNKYMTYQYTAMDFVRENVVIIVGVILFVAAIIISLLIRDSRRRKIYSAEIEKSRNELAEALKFAEQANDAKSAFLFNMSHDIRTPMNAIIGFTHLLEKNSDDSERRKDYIHKIQSSSDFLLSLINNVLEMSRIESGKTVLDEVPWSVEQFNDSIYSVFDEQMKSKGIDFVREIHIEHEYVYCDTLKLREVFHNILSNAYKYTPQGGKITMILNEIPSDREGFVTFRTEITDTGIGMSAEYLPHLFEEFSRERSSTESKVGGTGLGMAIVKRLIEMMGGNIEVESELGKGTKFTVTLSHRIADSAENKQEVITDNHPDEFTGKRILLAEDNDLNAEIAMEILADMGLEVERADNGQACIDMLSKAAADYYHLVLMDIQMPVMNGYEATRKIREMSDPVKANIPILAMTANAFEEDRKEAYKAGMNGHLAKPINVNEVILTIKKIFV